MLVLNKSIAKDGKIELQNGATRTTLLVINKTGYDIDSYTQYDIEVGYLSKGNHRFYFLNQPKKLTKETKYLYINGEYGVDVVEGECLKQDESVGGYGNSRSTVTLVGEGAVLYLHTYKDRQDGRYLKCTGGEFRSISDEDAALYMHSDEVETL